MTSRSELAEAQNLDRARDANKALVAYACVKEARQLEFLEDARSGLDLQEWLTDLLSDLRHWARCEEVDFDKSVDLSRKHFNDEFDEEYEDAPGNEDENNEQVRLDRSGSREHPSAGHGGRVA